jgi:vacuole morphology and inheritance protein 14
MVLDSVPDIDLLQYLPRFVDGIFNMLKDSNKDIKQEAETCLAEFLREIKEAIASNVSFTSVIGSNL